MCAFHVLEVEPKLIEQYVVTGKARIIYRHLAQIGNQSMVAAEAMHCAAETGRFWDMRASIYERQNDLLGAGSIEGGLQFLAKELGIDESSFARCLQEQPYRSEIQADIDASIAIGIRSRPAFDVNGTRLIGLQRLETFANLMKP